MQRYNWSKIVDSILLYHPNKLTVRITDHDFRDDNRNLVYVEGYKLRGQLPIDSLSYNYNNQYKDLQKVLLELYILQDEDPPACPCGGGQSCIVDRRYCGDWVHEDTVLKAAGVPVRKNCYSEPTAEQLAVLNKEIGKADSFSNK